jgi:hypothetical protein
MSRDPSAFHPPRNVSPKMNIDRPPPSDTELPTSIPMTLVALSRRRRHSPGAAAGSSDAGARQAVVTAATTAAAPVRDRRRTPVTRRTHRLSRVAIAMCS